MAGPSVDRYLVNGLLFLNKASKLAGTAAFARQKAINVVFPPASKESMFAITVEEENADGIANEESEVSGAVVSKLAGNKLWACHFLVSFVNSSPFDSVVRCLDNLSANLLCETVFQMILMDHELRQMRIFVNVCDNLMLFIKPGRKLEKKERKTISGFSLQWRAR